MFDENGNVTNSLTLLSYLNNNSDLAFVTDKKIEQLALIKLHKSPGEFDVEFIYDPFVADGLKMKIIEPDKWKPITSHSSKNKDSKYIIVDPYTGNVLKKIRSRWEYIGPYY